jgi:rhamnogalacturonan endolyase
MAAATVRISEEPGRVALDNGLTTAVFDTERGRLTSWVFDGQELLANGGVGMIQVYVNRGLPNPVPSSEPFRHSFQQRSERVVDLAFHRHASNGVRIDHHWVLREGDAALYNYIVVGYSGVAPAVLEQINTGLRLDPQIFNYASIGPEKQGYLPSPEQMKAGSMVMDATYLLPDGTVDAKYDWTLDEWGHRNFGLMGSGIGVFCLKGSGEHMQAGPSARELSVHQTTSTPILLRHFVAGHYGAGRINLAPETNSGWSKLGGPWAFLPVRGENYAAMQAQADARSAELAAEWPYHWIEHPNYLKERGAVRGRLLVKGQPAPAGALVVLSPPPAEGQPNWQTMGRDGYQFWSRVGANGEFRIEKIVPGAYTLWAVVDGEFNEFRHDGVQVAAHRETALGELNWVPPLNGFALWQIGRPDRTAGEFRNGDDYRHWGLWLRYPEQFPRDVDYVIGRSSERYDWNYLHTAVGANGAWRLPEWKIRFNLESAMTGRGTLRVAVAGASAHAGELTGAERWVGVNFQLNGQPLGQVRMPNDSASTRSSIRGRYYHFELPFDASRLQAGENLVTLQIESLEPVGINHNFPYAGVMYDALRLEVDPTQ